MSKFWVVTRHVYLKNVRSASWLISIATPLLFALLVGGMVFFMAQTASTAKVGVVSSEPGVTAALRKRDTDTKYINYTTATAGQQALKRARVDGLVVVTAKGGQLRAQITKRRGGTTVATTGITALMNQLQLQMRAATFKLSAGQLQALMAPATITTKAVEFKDGKKVTAKGNDDDLNSMLSVGVSVLMMLFLLVYGGMLAQEIATEKGSRIMEILLSSAGATTHFFGKLAGIFGLLLTQLGIYAVAALIGWPIITRQAGVQALLDQFDLSSILSASGVYILLFFLIGTLTYSVLAALTGSLVSTQEQVQQAVMPVTILAMLGYFIALTAQGGDSILVKVASYIPFLNVSVMPVRLAMGYATGLMPLIALVEAVVFLAAFTWLTAKIYRTNVLVYGSGGVIKSLKTSLLLMSRKQAK